MRIAISGLGRIGKTFLRVLLADKQAQQKLDLVAINLGPDDPSTLVQAIKHDTLMGIYDGPVDYSNGVLHVGPHTAKICTETDASQLPWRDIGVDWVIECSGHYTNAEDARQHIHAGAQKVLISAPGKGVDCTVIRGVNDAVYNRDKHTIVSLGSCTTNALMPLLKILADTTGIENAMVITTHAYTNSQKLLDSTGAQDPRKRRAAALNIIPTATGASRLIGEVLPELAGKVTASALRVPVPTVSLLDVTWVAAKAIKPEVVNRALEKAAQSTMQGVLTVCNEQLVSSDYIGNSHSVIVDTNLSQFQGNMGKLCGWYDNEWGYSERLKDFLITSA